MSHIMCYIIITTYVLYIAHISYVCVICYLYNIHMEDYYLVESKQEVLSLARTWVELESMMLHKISEVEKYKYSIHVKSKKS